MPLPRIGEDSRVSDGAAAILARSHALNGGCFTSRDGKGAPRTMPLPRIGEDSRVSDGAAAILAKQYASCASFFSRDGRGAPPATQLPSRSDMSRMSVGARRVITRCDACREDEAPPESPPPGEEARLQSTDTGKLREILPRYSRSVGSTPRSSRDANLRASCDTAGSADRGSADRGSLVDILYSTGPDGGIHAAVECHLPEELAGHTGRPPSTSSARQAGAQRCDARRGDAPSAESSSLVDIEYHTELDGRISARVSCRALEEMHERPRRPSNRKLTRRRSHLEEEVAAAVAGQLASPAASSPAAPSEWSAKEAPSSRRPSARGSRMSVRL